MMWLMLGLIMWIAGFALNIYLMRFSSNRFVRLAIPIIFGICLLVIWEAIVRGLQIEPVLLPAPSVIAARFSEATHILWVDFVQTVLKGMLSGYVVGCGAAVIFAIIMNEVDFLKRGFMPIANFVAALPIIGTAPILVMWFGFDWQSKSAVVVMMVFFPMLLNTIEGLHAADKIQRDLMKTYGAGYWDNLVKLKLPMALPFIFNGLKISTTLALIGAIVAEFFGSPVKGMGFRISTSVGQLDLALVWSEITVAAIVGMCFYGGIALCEKYMTFWHPSQRGRA